MPNRPLKMNKLRTIIRLYTDRVGLRAIAEMARTSRNTVKKYVNKWNTLSLTYKEFLSKSDAELYALFCIEETPVESNPRIDALEAFLVEFDFQPLEVSQFTNRPVNRYPQFFGVGHR